MSNSTKTTRIVVIPHFVGTEKDTVVFKKLITDIALKKIKEFRKEGLSDGGKSGSMHYK